MYFYIKFLYSSQSSRGYTISIMRYLAPRALDIHYYIKGISSTDYFITLLIQNDKTKKHHQPLQYDDTQMNLHL